MIQVFYWPREQRLVMKGHAEKRGGGYSPVVCEAATTLFQALVSTSYGFLKYRLVKGRYHKELKGIGYVKLWPKRRYFKRTRVGIGICVSGLLILADKYPDLVRVHVATGVPFDDAAAIEEAEQGGVSYLNKFVYDMTKDRPLSTEEGGAEPNREARRAQKRKNGQKGNSHG